MSVDALLTAAIGAFFGAAGWLLVGLFMQRRQSERQARNAARAVYFELTMNTIDINVAAEHLVFQPLRRGSFDSLLPELATWLQADELETIVKAYMSHAGYDQAQRDDKLPVQVRTAVLRHVLDQHHSATELLLRRSFSPREAARLSTANPVATAAGAEPSRAAAGARNA
jgi:hypothetical protein